MSTMNTSSFEYEYYEYDIKISMDAYVYQKLWVWLKSTHRFEYSLLISDVHLRHFSGCNVFFLSLLDTLSSIIEYNFVKILGHQMYDNRL